MKHPARWITIAVAVVVAVIGIVLATQVGTDPTADTRSSPLLGKAAPQFSVRTLDGARVTNTTLAGKAVIVNFWNTWCTPCREEHDALSIFYARHANEPDFAMVGIVRDDTARAVGSYQKRTPDPWAIALDPSSAASLAFGTRGQPETYAISPDGLVAGAQIGPATVESLDRMLDAARRIPQ